MKKKVLHIIPGFEIGGIESLFLGLAKEIDKEKYKLYLLTERKIKSLDFEYLRKNKVIIYENIYSVKKNIISYYKFISELMKKEKFDIVHIHGFFTRPLPLFLAKLNKVKKIIVHAHSTRLDKNEKIGKFLTKILLNDKIRYLACSEQAGECYFGKRNDIKVIINGIDFSKFIFNKEIKNEYISKFKLENKKIIGVIGRISYQKNQRFAIEIFEKLEILDENYLLLLIGNEADEKGIPQLVKERCLEEKIIFLGARNDIKELLSLLDIYLMPSRYEGLSVGLLEAQASGVQCLISDTITPKNIITNNVKILSLNDKPEIWAEEIIKLYKKGREDINYEELENSEYSIKTFVKKIEEVYSI